MALTNRQRIDKGLEYLTDGLQPFVERELESHLGKGWLEAIQQGFKRPLETDSDGRVKWDSYALLKTLIDQWTVFRQTLGKSERSFISELQDVRNKHAHEEKLSYDDTERALDTMRRLLLSLSAQDPAEAVTDMRKDLIRVQQAEEARKETRKAAAIQGTPLAGLRPWREVITPHQDVAAGTYLQAEFAADLSKVHAGKASSEYSDAREFFSRTFLTEGLCDLIEIGLNRLSSKGGDPVVELKTNFGGGKTHSMLALYHLFGGGKANDMPGVDQIMQDKGISAVPAARRAVLVGTALSPAQPRKKTKSISVHTLWGEMAWQLGAEKGYDMVAESDRNGISPGSDDLEALLRAHAPCLVLIDEWVAFLRQLPGKDQLPGGSYDANLTFAQALTEAVKAVPNALVVASLPVSDIEIGGTNGEQALKSLSNTFKRLAKPWKPASTDESFEIVRRRLFDSTMDYPARDAVVKAFSELYREQYTEFPLECREAEYRRKLEACYPIHPELFDQFDNRWSTLEKFQRTRGVLRLMASVIHELWSRGDGGLLIMPSSITLDAASVKSLICECLPDGSQWEAVISADVDGANALPATVDKNTRNLGRYSAALRVARSIFMGAAPTVSANSPGIQDNRMRLSCTQPGESVATFGDALRRLTDQSVHLYVDKGRYWYSLQASVTRLARDRADQLKGQPEIDHEIVRRLRMERKLGDFEGVHIAPESSADVPDELYCRLVILGPECPFAGREVDQAEAGVIAREILDKRGNTPRQFRNSLVFLAPEEKPLKDLRESVCQFMAWKSIRDEAESNGLDLSQFAKQQSRTKTEESDKACSLRLHEAWSRVLVPLQPDPAKPNLEWEVFNVPGGEELTAKVWKKLIDQEALFTVLGAPRLKMELDRYLWKDKDHIGLKFLLESCAQFLFLPRLASKDVLKKAIHSGLPDSLFCEFYAYATSYDEDKKHYTGLQANGLTIPVEFDASSVLVKPEIARRQLEGETSVTYPEPTSGAVPIHDRNRNQFKDQQLATEPKERKVTRYFGSVSLDPKKAGLQFSDIMQEVVQHFTSKLGTRVHIKVEIEAEAETGFDDASIRTVRENSQTLGFTEVDFEED